MSVVINSNYAATVASNNLTASNQRLQASLNRLSSGSRIVNPADDAGGLAVSMKLSAAAVRQGAVTTNVANAVSMLQTQDGVLKVTGSILSRMSELKVLNNDVTKSASDKSNYQTEFSALQAQLNAMGGEKFNGVNLFGSTSQSVVTTEDGTGSVAIQGVDLLGSASAFPTTFTDTFSSLGNWTNTSSGAGTATPGSGVTFADGSGSASITSQATFTGATTIQFDIASGDAQVDLGGAFLNGFIGFAGSTIKLVLDGAGNMQTFVDNVSLGTTGGAPTAGQLKLYAVPVGQGGSGNGSITNFSVTNAGGGGGGTGNVNTVATATDLNSLSLSSVTDAISDVATYRAQNGADQSRLGFASELLTVNKTNLEAANSRITDVDVAAESTTLARYNILVQAGTAMLSQANQSSQMALKLLQ